MDGVGQFRPHRRGSIQRLRRRVALAKTRTASSI